MAKRMIVFGAHSDDIETACGGTIAKYAQAGYDCVYVLTTQSPNYHATPEQRVRNDVPSNEDIINIRKSEARKGAKILGVSEIHFWDFKCLYYYQPGTLDRVNLDGQAFQPEVYDYLMKNVSGREFLLTAPSNTDSLDFIGSFIRERSPEIIITMNPCDVHMEHYASAILIRNALRKMALSGIRVYAFQENTHDPMLTICPTHMIDISDVIEQKLKACDPFPSQCIEQNPALTDRRGYAQAFAREWGRLIGVEYAEPFYQYCPVLPAGDNGVSHVVNAIRRLGEDAGFKAVRDDFLLKEL